MERIDKHCAHADANADTDTHTDAHGRVDLHDGCYTTCVATS